MINLSSLSGERPLNITRLGLTEPEIVEQTQSPVEQSLPTEAWAKWEQLLTDAIPDTFCVLAAYLRILNRDKMDRELLVNKPQVREFVREAFSSLEEVWGQMGLYELTVKAMTCPDLARDVLQKNTTKMNSLMKRQGEPLVNTASKLATFAYRKIITHHGEPVRVEFLSDVANLLEQDKTDGNLIDYLEHAAHQRLFAPYYYQRPDDALCKQLSEVVTQSFQNYLKAEPDGRAAFYTLARYSAWLSILEADEVYFDDRGIKLVFKPHAVPQSHQDQPPPRRSF